jgi:two-component system LytT family response regulator
MSNSKKYSVLIVDDESLARRIVREYLRSHPEFDIIAEAEDGLEAVQILQEHSVDLVFLDIQMPQLTGFEVLQNTGRNHGVIFTTAYDQYALKAFDQHAIDYLLKPFNQQRFNEALEKARKLCGHTLNNLEQLNQQVTMPIQRLVVRDRGQDFVIPVSSIEYIQAQDDYIQIHYSGKSILKTQSLSELEKLLDPKQFIRIHRSTIVNLNSLKLLEKINKDSVQAILHSGQQLAVSRSGQEKIKAVL